MTEFQKHIIELGILTYLDKSDKPCWWTHYNLLLFTNELCSFRNNEKGYIRNENYWC